MAACALPLHHDGPHEDAETVWHVSVAPPRAASLRGRVFAAVEAKPWITAREIVELLGESQLRVSGALAKLYVQGKVERRRMLGGDDHGVAFAYRARTDQSTTSGLPERSGAATTVSGASSECSQ